jgi:hypothetical protein
MADKRSRNLVALQGDDSHICDIAEEVAHVEVYKFDPASAKWDKMGVAGTGFIVIRSSEPKYRFQVLNKSGIENFSMDVDKISKTKEQAPYIMVKCTLNGAPVILGLWVHDEGERGQLLSSLSSAIAGTLGPRPAGVSNSGTNALKSLLKSPGAAVGAAVPKKVRNAPAPSPQPQVQLAHSYKDIAIHAEREQLLTDREIAARKAQAHKAAQAGSAHTPPGGVLVVSLGALETAAVSSYPTTPSQKLLKSIIRPSETHQAAEACLLLSPSDITGKRRKFLKTEQ